MLSTEFLLLAGAHFLALASPGPDFLLLLRNTLRHGRRNGIGAALGIALANGLYIALALSGFSLLQDIPGLLTVMKWGASVYLAWLGWRFLQASRQGAGLPGAVQGGRLRAGFVTAMGAGFLSAALNPKNGLFYFGLFTVMVDAATGPMRKLLYGAWMFVAVLLWDLALVGMLARPATFGLLSRGLPLIERGAGLLLMAAAVWLALSKL